MFELSSVRGGLVITGTGVGVVLVPVTGIGSLGSMFNRGGLNWIGTGFELRGRGSDCPVVNGTKVEGNIVGKTQLG